MVRSSFFEFNVALSGLYTAKGGIQTTGHNIANAATPGFSRQYVEQRASTPLTYYNGKGMIGTGSEIYGVGQMRNYYLDTKYWAEKCVLGEFYVKNTQLNIMEGIFNEMSSSGLNANFNSFFQKLQDLSTTAGDSTYRTNVTQAGQELAKFINNTTESLKRQQRDVNEEVRTVVQIINSLGQQIRSLNEQINKFEMDGSKANDMRDQRALLIDELSQYVNLEVKETELNEDYAKGLYPEPEDRVKSKKELTIMINGYEFIKGWDIIPLKVVERDAKTNPMDVPGLYDIYFEGSNVKFDIHHPELQGQLKGLIDIRDGNSGYYLSTTSASTVAFSSTDIVSGFTVPYSEFVSPPPLSGTITATDNSVSPPDEKTYNYTAVLNPGPPETYEFTFSGNTPSHIVTGDMSNYSFDIAGATAGSGSTITSTQITGTTTYTQIDVTDVTRVDLDPNGGYVTVIDPTTNLPVKYKYIKMVADANGKDVTFILDSSSNVPSSYFTNPPKELNVAKTSPYKGIPHYLDRLNELVRTFAKAINEGIPGTDIKGHVNGYDTTPERQNLELLFFSYAANVTDIKSGPIDYNLMTCENFQVSSLLIDHPDLLAMAESAESGIDDNRIIHGFFKIQNYGSLFAEGKLTDFIIGTAGELGIDNKQAANFQRNYTDITTTIENQRMSVSGVDLNEEFTNLLKYQQIYVSCAKLLSVINEIYDVTINRMGL